MLKRAEVAPDQRDVCSALNEMLHAEGLATSIEPSDISAVAGTRRPTYHVLVPTTCTMSTSVLLTRLLERPFTEDLSGWLIDASEARALIEAAHRLGKTRFDK